MSGIHFEKVFSDLKHILSRNRVGRTTLEKILIPAGIALLSVCILLGVLLLMNRNAGAKGTDATTPTSVLGAARGTSGKDETEPGSSVTASEDAGVAALTEVTDADDIDMSSSAETTKAAIDSSTTSKETTKTAGTNAPAAATMAWSEVTITPTTAASAFLFTDLFGDIGSISTDPSITYSTDPSATYSTDPSTSISIPTDLGTIPTDLGTIPSLTY